MCKKICVCIPLFIRKKPYKQPKYSKIENTLHKLLCGGILLHYVFYGLVTQ